METLTVKGMLLNLLSGKPIDRIPVSPRVYRNVVYEHFGSSNVDVVEGAIEFCRHFGIDIIDWNCSPDFVFPEFTLEGPYWKPRIRKEVSGKTTWETATVETPGGKLRRVVSTTQIGRWEEECAVTEYPIKTERDFHLIADYQPPVPRLDTGSISRAMTLIGDDGIVSPGFHGPFNILAYAYRKLDDLLIDVVVEPDFYRRMMEYFLARLTLYAQQVIDLKPPLVDVGVNIANSRVVSADFWLENILPYENRFADVFQDQGVCCLFHNCGYAGGHLHVYPQLHHRAWGYLAPAPHGDTVLEEALQKLPRSLILWGNIDQIDFLRRATPKEVEERVRQVIETVKPRGNFILGTTDYLEVETPAENLRAFVDAGRRHGSYEV